MLRFVRQTRLQHLSRPVSASFSTSPAAETPAETPAETTPPTPKEPRKSVLRDPFYELQKEASGYNAFAAEKVTLSSGRVVPNIWTKKYRLGADGAAVLPEKYKNVNYQRLQKVLQKADHEFFKAEIPGPLRINPIDDEHKKQISGFNKVMLEIMDEQEADFGTETAKHIAAGLHNSLPSNLQRKLHLNKMTSLNFDDIDIGIDGEESLRMKEADVFTNDFSQGERVIAKRNDDTYWNERRAEYVQKLCTMMPEAVIVKKRVVRVTRATGRIDSHAALVVLGNGKGLISYGKGKGLTDDDATMQAIWECRKTMLFVPLLEGRTLFTQAMGKWNQTRVHLKPQGREVGLTACQLLQDLLDTLGIEDCSARIFGRRNAYSILYAFFEALKQQRSFRQLALDRGVNFYDMMDPYRAPPHPSTAEMKQMEEDASKAFAQANALYTDPFDSTAKYTADKSDRDEVLNAMAGIKPGRGGGENKSRTESGDRSRSPRYDQEKIDPREVGDQDDQF